MNGTRRDRPRSPNMPSSHHTLGVSGASSAVNTQATRINAQHASYSAQHASCSSQLSVHSTVRSMSLVIKACNRSNSYVPFSSMKLSGAWMQELYRRRSTLTYLLAYVRAQAFNWTYLVSAYQRRQANKAVLLKKEASLPLGLDQVELLLLHAFSLTDWSMSHHLGAVCIGANVIRSSLGVAASRYASLFTGSTDTMRSFFAQPDHIGVFHYVVDCLDFTMI